MSIPICNYEVDVLISRMPLFKNLIARNFAIGTLLLYDVRML